MKKISMISKSITTNTIKSKEIWSAATSRRTPKTGAGSFFHNLNEDNSREGIKGKAD